MSKIRVIHKTPVLNDLGVILSVVELAGPSSETKPTTGFANGSLFLETDTGKIFIFDEDDGWSEVETGGGGGGGGDSSSVLYVNYDDEEEILDASYNEIKAAVEAGKVVVCEYHRNEHMIVYAYLSALGDDTTYYACFTYILNGVGAATLDLWADDPDEDMYWEE